MWHMDPQHGDKMATMVFPPVILGLQLAFVASINSRIGIRENQCLINQHWQVLVTSTFLQMASKTMGIMRLCYNSMPHSMIPK